MGRFSPTVLPEAFDLGGIIDQIREGYFGGRQQKEDSRRRKRLEGREDAEAAEVTRRRGRLEGREDRAENAYLSALRTDAVRDLADRDGGFGLLPTIETSGVELPGVEGPTILELPDPDYVASQFQGEPTYFKHPSVRAQDERDRQKDSLGDELEGIRQRARAGIEGRRLTPEQRAEDVTHQGAMSAARRVPAEPELPEPPKSLDLVERQIKGAREDVDLAFSISPSYPEPGPGGAIDPVLQAAFDAGRQRVEAAQGRLDSLNTVRDSIVGGFMDTERQGGEGEVVPEQRPEPPRTGSPYRRGAGPLREFENAPESEGAGLFSRLRGIFRPRLDVTTDPAQETGAAVDPNLTVAQKQQAAEREWEELVDAGTDPDEATKLLREKYGLPGGQ